MAADYRRGDRSKRNDDRYLFLEALLSAEEHFYISYEGRSLKDNKIKPASVLVSELTDYLQRVYGESFVIEHPLQPFNEKYFDADYPQLKTYAGSWYQALCAESAPRLRFQDTELEDNDDGFELTDLDQLTRFFRHPARYYFRRLGVFFERNDFELNDTETFQLDSLERYGLAESALQAMINQQPLPAWEAQMLSDGIIMEGVVGRQQLEKEKAKAEAVYNTLSEGDAPVEPTVLALTLDLNETTISAEIPCLGEQHVNFRTGTLRKRQLLEVWLRHLFLNATGYERESYLISTKNNKAILSYLTAVKRDDARQLMQKFVDLYHLGITTPLLFLPETSHTFLQALDQNDQNINLARSKALQEYNQELPGVEGQDYSNNRLFTFPDDFTDEFQNIARAIYDPLMAHWEGDK
jgi:exodeoxyribonuclease V gamma subunit